MILLQFTSALVLLQAPASFIAFVLVTLLGQLSVVYKRTTKHRFDIEKQCSTAAVKLIQNSIMFEQFADTCDGESTIPNAISKESSRHS